MGNVTSASYVPSPEIVFEIQVERFYEMLEKRGNNVVRDVNMSGDTFNHYLNKYRVELISKMPKNGYLIVLFPQHPNPRKRVLYTNNFRSSASFNKELNDRFRNTHTGLNPEFRMAIACGKQVYRLRNLTATSMFTGQM